MISMLLILFNMESLLLIIYLFRNRELVIEVTNKLRDQFISNKPNWDISDQLIEDPSKNLNNIEIYSENLEIDYYIDLTTDAALKRDNNEGMYPIRALLAITY